MHGTENKAMYACKYAHDKIIWNVVDMDIEMERDKREMTMPLMTRHRRQSHREIRGTTSAQTGSLFHQTGHNAHASASHDFPLVMFLLDWSTQKIARPFNRNPHACDRAPPRRTCLPLSDPAGPRKLVWLDRLLVATAAVATTAAGFVRYMPFAWVDKQKYPSRAKWVTGPLRLLRGALVGRIYGIHKNLYI